MPLSHGHLVELLDRRFKVLDGQAGQDYLLHLIAFADFLFNDPEISFYVRQLLIELQDRIDVFNGELNEEIESIKVLRDDVLRAFPELDDSDMEPPQSILEGTWDYESSFAHFGDLVQGTKRIPGERIPSSVGAYDDDSTPGVLLNILRSKIRIKLDESDRQANQQRSVGVKVAPVSKELDGLWARCRSLDEQHSYRFRAFVNYRRTSPGQGLVNMRDIAQRLNREPAKFSSLREYAQSRSFADIVGYGYLEDLLYQDNPNEREIQTVVEAGRRYAHLAYEGLRERIGRLGARVQVIERYKTRCTWFEADAVRAIAESQGELGLTRHLALFLFDQGLPVVTRLKLGVHEFDVAGLAEGSILVEAKVYSGRQAPAVVKRNVLQGVSQIHSYLNSFEAATGIREAYLVVFRAGGPLLDMPDRITTPRLSIFPVVIDVGEAKESGSRQPKPIVIAEEDLPATFSKKKR